MQSQGFLELASGQIHMYSGFPFPVFLCDRGLDVQWANGPAVFEYGGGAGHGDFFSEFDTDDIFAKLETHGSLVLRDAVPMSDRLVSLLPIYGAEGGGIAGLTALILPDTQTPRQGRQETIMGQTPAALSGAISDGAQDIFTAMDAAFTKAAMMGGAVWLAPHLNEISIQAYRMLRTAANVSMFSRLRQGGLSLRQKPFDICAYLQEIWEAVSGICGAAGVPAELDIPDGSVFIYADMECFEHSLYNIIYNSVLYTRPGNRITLSVYTEGGNTCIAVRDKGMGIPPELSRQVFRPYFSHPAPGKSPGIGLGLTIAKRLTEMQGGSFILESEQDIGTAAVLSLPEHNFSRVLTLEQSDDAPYPLTDRFSGVYIGLVGILDKPYQI
ncbi:MAG: HAMP domain-containing histidine kinase [Oscillospiraceae bacterium]|nr:HAMP domain-containing histidine kinase [Oscillospiraceae bacterium]